MDVPSENRTRTLPRVAAITTVWRKDSHADVIIPKMLAGYDLDGTVTRPGVTIASLYVEQFPDNDLSRGWADRFGVPLFPAVGDALTLGTGDLAVDAVLIVGEHGEYPWNEKGQHLYPRRRFFADAVRVVDGTGRSVPFFNDKHLSYSWDDARWMYDTAGRLGLPLMAGSSLPVTYRIPDADVPLGSEIQEALVISHGPAESYGFHALETLQCMIERRRGGETGVAAVELLHGDAFWEAWRNGRFPDDLYQAALATLPDRPAGDVATYYAEHPTRSGAPSGPQPPLAFVVTYRGGPRATLLNLSGFVRDFAFAARLRPPRDGTPGSPGAGEWQTLATCFKLEGQPPRWHFSFLVHHIERFFQTGTPPYPVERTLLTTGTLAALMDAGHAGRERETPHLAVSYTSPETPWRRSRGRSLSQEEVWGFRPEDLLAGR